MKKKNSFSTVILLLFLIIGLSLLLYPSFSDYWNKKVQSYAVVNYIENVSQLDDTSYREILDQAKEYNQSLRHRENPYGITEEQQAQYRALLNPFGSDIMGYIEIPSINVNLPVYHGTEDSVLQVAVGHLEWTSLPVGGEGTHCVLSGHRGLPSARLFTDLDQLQQGDTFLLQVLDETLTYEVDQILIVLPHEVEALLAEEGKDLCTLVTCTPYGVNSHRMLVRGHRVENEAQAVVHRVTADGLRVEPLVVAAVLYLPILILLLFLSSLVEKLLRTSGKNSSRRKYHEDL